MFFMLLFELLDEELLDEELLDDPLFFSILIFGPEIFTFLRFFEELEELTFRFPTTILALGIVASIEPLVFPFILSEDELFFFITILSKINAFRSVGLME